MRFFSHSYKWFRNDCFFFVFVFVHLFVCSFSTHLFSFKYLWPHVKEHLLPHSTGHLPHTATGNCWPESWRARGNLEAPSPSSTCQHLQPPVRKWLLYTRILSSVAEGVIYSTEFKVQNTSVVGRSALVWMLTGTISAFVRWWTF